MTFFVGLLGAAVGSFLNVLIDRIPRGEDIISKPSHCDFCRKKLRWYELIPLVSYLLQRGRCIRCRKKLSLQYPLIELVTAIGFMFLYPHVVSLVIFCAFFVIFVIDWKHQIIPDSMLVVLFFCAVAVGLGYNKLASALLSGAGFFALWAGTRGRGLGFGDVKLVAILGLLLGYPTVIIALYVAFLTGALWGVILMLMRRAKLKSKIAFGPFLIVGAWISYLWGDVLWSFWLTLL